MIAGESVSEGDLSLAPFAICPRNALQCFESRWPARSASSVGLGTDRLLWTSIAGLFLAFVALAAAAPASTALATSLMVIWALVAMLFQAPQQKRLIGLAPQWRGLVLAMNASALYLGMSLGTVAGTQAYRAWGLDSLAVLSATITVLAGIAQWRSQRSATAQSANLAQARNATSV
jgi:DHA1 family inner membrane transport protein